MSGGKSRLSTGKPLHRCNRAETWREHAGAFGRLCAGSDRFPGVYSECRLPTNSFLCWHFFQALQPFPWCSNHIAEEKRQSPVRLAGIHARLCPTEGFIESHFFFV